MTLGDGVLIKDNHLAALHSCGLSMGEIVAKTGQNARLSLWGARPFSLRGAGAARPRRGRWRRRNVQVRESQIEVEGKTLEEAKGAAEAGADIVMLDNIGLEDMRQALEAIQGRALIEASAGITPEKVRAVAETGVDFISLGVLMHSARALDISLELEMSDE